MRFRQIGSVILIPALAAIAGCGSGDKAQSGANETSPATVTTSADWATNACHTFEPPAAAKAAGVAVTKGELGLQSSGGPAIGSTCSYANADGETQFTVLLRQDTTGSETIESQAAALAAHEEITGRMEPVAMRTGKAFWAPGLRTLSYIPDNARMIVVTPPGAIGPGRDSDAALREHAVAIASAVPL